MQSITSFAEANRILAGFYPNSRTKYTLGNMRKLMDYLDNPQDNLKVVHVAGTSGKTSTAYYVSALLTEGRCKTGLTVSPHVDEINERIQINGQPINETEFCNALTEFLRLIEDSHVKPSWFEAMVAYAYWYFDKQKVDYAVVEVGLGGLKDGTNVVNRKDKICVITDIGLDHTSILGETIEEITQQKAGIIQDQNVVIVHKQADEIMDVLKRAIKDKQAELIIADQQQIERLPIYQQRNWSLANEAYNYLSNRDDLPHLTEQALKATQMISMPGRMDVKHVNGKTLIMDGAHNVQKMTAFLNSFKKLYPDTKPAILIGAKDDKEYKDIVPLLEPLASRIITTAFDASQDLPIQSTDSDKLAKAFNDSELDVQSIPDQRDAYKTLISGHEDVCIITGSFYLLGKIRNNEHLI